MNWAACGRRAGAAEVGGWQHAAVSAALSPDFSCISSSKMQLTCNCFEMPMSSNVVAKALSELLAMHLPVR